MFFPQILRGPFGRRYLIARYSCSGYHEPLCRDSSAAKFLLQRLDASETYWRDLIASQHVYDLRYLAVSPQEFVANLFTQGTFKVYALPTKAELESFGRYSQMDPASETRYRLLPCNSHLLLNVQRTPVRTMDQAEKLLQSFELSEQQLTELAAKLPRDTNSTEPTALSRICRALVDGMLVITTESVPSRSAKKNVVSDEVPQAPVRPSLGPHDDPDYVPPPPRESVAVPPSAPNEPAQSLEECERRLEEARTRLQAHGYQPKYSDEEIRAQAQTGELDDRFLVRFMETEHATPDGYLGRNEDGVVKYWSTTFNQLENADTDPETLCGVLGITYDSKKTYTLAIVDNQGKGSGQSTTIVPTYKQLGAFAAKEVKGIDPAVAEKVMTPEYSEVYAEEMVAFRADGRSIDKESDVKRYSNERFSSTEESDQLWTRARVQQDLGANEHYTGDGTTKNLLPGENQCGVMETFTYDKNPQTLAQLGETGSLKLIETKLLSP